MSASNGEKFSIFSLNIYLLYIIYYINIIFKIGINHDNKDHNNNHLTLKLQSVPSTLPDMLLLQIQ